MAEEERNSINNNSRERLNRLKDSVSKWLKDPYNLAILGIVILAFIIRIHYIILTKGQTLWWDESEYMSTAKHWAFGVPYELNEQRPPVFQLLGALLLRLGFEEFALKFFLVVIPSTAVIYIIFLLGKELFNKRVGICAALASAGMWSFLFWGARFQPDFLSLTFQLLSIFYFWKLFKNPESKYALLAGLFAAMGFYFKISALLVPLSVFVFILFKDGLKFIKNRIYWRALLSFIISLIPFGIWQYILFGSPAAFAPSYIGGRGISERPLGWMTLDFFYGFPKILFFVLFLIGLAAAIFRIGISFDILMKDEKRRFDSYIFSIMFIILVSSFYIFYIQGAIEDRWVFIMAPFLFYFAADGMLLTFSYLKIRGKYVIAALMLLLFVFFYVQQLNHADALIKNKLPSYSLVKEASVWIRDNSGIDDSVVSASYTQTTNYAERKVYPYAPYQNESSFTEFLLEKRPRYMMLSNFENHPQWAYQMQIHPNGMPAKISLPYLNSTVLVDQQGQAIVMDIKEKIQIGNMRFTLVYPKNQINGVFVYEITYA